MAAIFQNGRPSKLYLTSHLNLNVTTSQPVLQIEPSYLCLHQCFWGQRIHWNSFLMTRIIAQCKMAAILENGHHSNLYLTSHSNLIVTISQPVLHIEPSHLCLHPCFEGQRFHWNYYLMTKNILDVKWRPFWKMATNQNYIWPVIQTLMWPYLRLYCK